MLTVIPQAARMGYGDRPRIATTSSQFSLAPGIFSRPFVPAGPSAINFSIIHHG
ncbi:hypothetical protein D082_14460 [Synechocystis sp. PCC 6714]|nr:hypothetical protein D082_14460 [Synechocystis sp. PCC 6714]